MSGLSDAERAALHDAGQGHLADAADAAGGDARRTLLADIRGLDLPLVSDLVRRFVHGREDAGHAGEIAPPEAVALPASPEERDAEAAAAARGEEFLRAGRLALVLLAGGQGSRLGFDGPKGRYPYGPVTGTTLFAQHAHRVHALRARYGAGLPLYILTSPANDADTRAAFAEAGHFGLDPGSVRFVVQGTLPAVDMATGRILLDDPGHLALSPDGHGGLLMALRRSGALDRMRDEGNTAFFTFQVDNPLIRVANPAFVGHHGSAGADMSNLAVRKHEPSERVGVIASVDGRTAVVEYSDLPDELASLRAEDGRLALWAGNIATHVVDVAFADRLTDGGLHLPFHRAVKRVPHVGADGRRVEPPEPNAVKFETFIFDALGEARASVTVEVPREMDFSPIKNADGSDSPESARRDANRLYASWLEAAGVDVPRDADGEPAYDLEIDPRLALDADELAARLPPGTTITGPTALGPPDGS